MQPGREYLFPNDQSVFETKMQGGGISGNAGYSGYSDNTRFVNSLIPTKSKVQNQEASWYNKLIADNVYPYGTFGHSKSDFTIDNDLLYDLSTKFKNKEIDFKTYRRLREESSFDEAGNNIAVKYKNYKGSKPTADPKDLKASYDALYIHQGLPQKYNSFVPAKYKPSIRTDEKLSIYSLNPSYEKELLKDLFEGQNKDFLNSSEKQRSIKGSILAGASLKNFKYSKGYDENGNYISYYDLNDYGNILDALGTPFDVYGRFYYDPKTGKPITESSNNKSNELWYTPQMWDNSLSRAKKNNQMQNGGLFPVGPYDEMMAPKQGNYLLPDINRPSYIDDEGGRRSEYRTGVNIDGKETLLPTVVGARQLTDKQAEDQYIRTGLNMGKFNNVEDADYASRLRTARYNMLEDPVRFNVNQFQGGGMSIPGVQGTVVAAPTTLKEAYKKRKKK